MILDVTCGARLMWHNKHHPGVIYADQRAAQYQLSDGRQITISPNIRLDYRALPFRDNTFHLINLDPPHLQRAGATGWMCQKYGVLMTTWREDLRQCPLLDACSRYLERMEEQRMPVDGIVAGRYYTPKKRRRRKAKTRETPS